ncbi:MAG: response regulator [Phycisphaeraceae bacterium]
MLRRRSRDESAPRFIDPLRLAPEAERKLMADLWDQAGGYEGRERRQDERHPCDHRVELIVQMQHPGGTTPVRYLVRPRDVSTTGIGFLHGGFVYEGTRCRTILIMPDGAPLLRDGQAVRCRHVRGHVHEVGLLFDNTIDPAPFIGEARGDVQAGAEGLKPVESDSEALPQLAGHVLYVDDSKDSRALLEYVLAGSGISQHFSAAGAEALQVASSVRLDLILTEVNLPDMTGLELIQALRGEGCTAPAVAVTGDEAGPVGDTDAAGAYAEWILKPLGPEAVLPLLGRYLASTAAPAAEPLAPMHSEQWEQERMRPLILDFLRRLGPQIVQMTAALETPDGYKQLLRPALDIKSSAMGFGYPRLGEVAARLHQSAVAGTPPEPLREQLAELSKLHQAACLAVEIKP